MRQRTGAGLNAQRGGWSERGVKELGADVERVDEVGEQVVDVAHLLLLGNVEVVGGGDRRFGDARFARCLATTRVLHLPARRTDHTRRTAHRISTTHTHTRLTALCPGLPG